MASRICVISQIASASRGAIRKSCLGMADDNSVSEAGVTSVFSFFCSAWCKTAEYEFGPPRERSFTKKAVCVGVALSYAIKGLKARMRHSPAHSGNPRRREHHGRGTSLANHRATIERHRAGESSAHGVGQTGPNLSKAILLEMPHKLLMRGVRQAPKSNFGGGPHLRSWHGVSVNLLTDRLETSKVYRGPMARYSWSKRSRHKSEASAVWLAGTAAFAIAFAGATYVLTPYAPGRAELRRQCSKPSTDHRYSGCDQTRANNHEDIASWEPSYPKPHGRRRGRTSL